MKTPLTLLTAFTLAMISSCSSSPKSTDAVANRPAESTEVSAPSDSLNLGASSAGRAH